MAHPSFSMPDEVLQRFDAIRDEMKMRGELDLDTRRSPVARCIIENWVEEQEERLDLEDGYWVDEGNAKLAMVAD